MYELISDFLVKNAQYYPGKILHYCPACKELHPFAVTEAFSNGAKWTYNGDHNKPSFHPSMNISVGPYPDNSRRAGKIDRCHYWLKNGMIEYLPDSTHEMKGQTIPLPAIPERYKLL